MVQIIFRIDDRLIHGQVLEGWVHNLGLTKIIIVSDRICNDENLIQILEFSVPKRIKVEFFNICEMSEKIKESYLEKEDVIVLFEKPADVLSLLDYGVVIRSINVGCMHFTGYNVRVEKSVALSDDDIQDFKDISAMGTEVECRSLPQDKKLDMIELINRI